MGAGGRQLLHVSFKYKNIDGKAHRYGSKALSAWPGSTSITLYRGVYEALLGMSRRTELQIRVTQGAGGSGVDP
jgi:hypothetical protein